MITPFVQKDITLNKQRAQRLRWALFLGIILATLVGSWHLLQLRNPDRSPLENEFVPSEENPAIPRTFAPDFSLIDLQGTTFKLSEFRGRPVVIDFMATWCGTCRAMMPQLGMIWKQYADAIMLISIDVDPFETDETLRSFANEYPYATWIWTRDTAYLSHSYHITLIPTTVIIDQEGYIRFTHIGVIDAATLNHEIEQLLQSN